MRPRFQADADLKHAIIRGVRRWAPGIDFQRAEAVPLEGVPDLEVLAMAARDGRILVSHDKSTMIGHFREFIAASTSPGLILIPQTGLPIGRAIDDLLLVWEVLDSIEMENRICLLPSLAFLY